MTKKMFDLVLIETVLIGTAWKLYKLAAARYAATDNGGIGTIAEAVVGL